MQAALSHFPEELRQLMPISLGSDSTSTSVEDEPFNRLAVSLFRIQYALNEPYRALCQSRSIEPHDVVHWRQIPAVSTTAFKEYAFSCVTATKRTHHFESSGTTRSAHSRNYHSDESLQLYNHSLLPWFLSHLLPEIASAQPRNASPHSWKFLSLTPTLTDAPHSSLAHMLDCVSHQSCFNQVTFAGQRTTEGAWSLNFDSAQLALQNAIVETLPVMLAGTAFNLVHLLDALAQRNQRLPLPEGSRIMETGGYKGRSRELVKKDLHAALSNCLGVAREDIVTEYGMTELASQAYDTVAGTANPNRLLHFPPWARAMVVSGETGLEVAPGETGLLRIVDLANAFSVLAVETEDMAIRRNNGFELAGRATIAESRGCSLMTV